MAFLIPDNVIDLGGGLLIKQYFITEHNPNKISLPTKRTLPLLGVTCHNTNDINEARQTTDPEQYVRATINGNMGTVRVHFYVDDDEIWQMLPLDWQSWHAGQAGKADRNGSQAGNAQTISIECIMDGKGTDKDKKAEDNCARLIAYLMKQFGLTVEKDLYTHNYWCNVRNGRNGTLDALNKLNDGYKNCPVFIRPHWDDFKALVNKYLKADEKPADTDKNYLYNIVVGVYANKKNADEALKYVKKDYPTAFIKKTVKNS